MGVVASRVKFEITAKDSTAAAFGSVRRSMDMLNRSLGVLRTTFSIFAGGAVLSGLTRSFIEINRHVPAVGTAITHLQRAWQAFALKVGDAGLNKALVDFS